MDIIFSLELVTFIPDKLLKSFGFRIKAIEPFVRPCPYFTRTVFGQTRNEIVAYACGVISDMEKRFKFFAIVPAEAICRANPDKSLPVL